MKLSIRKKTLCLSIAVSALTVLVACGQTDQNQVTTVSHRGLRTSAGCGASDVATSINGLQLAIAVHVTGDTMSNMQSCLVAPTTPTSTSATATGFGTTDATPTTTASGTQAAAAMSNDAATITDTAIDPTIDSTSGTTADAAKAALPAPATSASAATASAATAAGTTTTSTSPSSAATATTVPTSATTATNTTTAAAAPSTSTSATDTSAATSDYQAAMTACTPASTALPTGWTKMTGAQLIDQKKNGTYQLTSVTFVINETNEKTNNIGLISATTTGLIAVTPPNGQLPNGVIEKACGGWTPGHGKIDARLMIPNEIRATDMAPISKRLDVMTAEGGVVAVPVTTITTNVTRINVANKKQNLQKLSGPGLESALYQDGDGNLFVVAIQDRKSGPYHSVATAIGSYTLKTE